MLGDPHIEKRYVRRASKTGFDPQARACSRDRPWQNCGKLLRSIQHRNQLGEQFEGSLRLGEGEA
jgi:hypothetical protein